MDIIQQEREDIIRENNTAQETLENMTADFKPSIQKLTVNLSLYGNLDLAFLGEHFKELRTIIFQRGKITEIRNIPVGIAEFEIPDNLITDFENLPGSLLYLNLDNNYLKTLDLVNVPHLEVLSCNQNRIEEFKHMPSSLKKLYCNRNELQKLDLHGLGNLETLHCSQNPLLKISNLPNRIHDFIAENSPFALEIENATEDDDDEDEEEDDDTESLVSNAEEREKDAKAVEKKINYLDALQIYYKAKRDYETKYAKKRQSAYKNAPTKKMGQRAALKVKPLCIYCNRQVGSRFYTNSTGHFAMCGDKVAPCALNVKLLRGGFSFNEDMLYWFKEDVDKEKINIIKHKLDTLFNYLSDEVAVKNFKQIFEKYKDLSSVYEDFLKMHEELYFDEHRKEMIRAKGEKTNDILENIRTLIEEYKQSENPSILKTATELYIWDLIPEMENLRRLKYDKVEMEDDTMIQWQVGLQKLENSHTDEPQVVHFKGM
jgi:hypothetical protein